MVVRECMNPEVISITPDESVALAARLLSRYGLGVLPVCSRAGALKGILTDRDIILRCVAVGQTAEQTPVCEIMSHPCASISPDESLERAARCMAHNQVRRLPVVESGHLVGIVTLGDLARSRQLDMEAACALSEISDSIRHL